MSRRMDAMYMALASMMMAADNKNDIPEPEVHELTKEEREAVWAENHGLNKYGFEDGFTCYARNFKNARRKHKNWINCQTDNTQKGGE